MSDFSTPAGWYPDGEGWERRWDGSGWTDERRPVSQPTQVPPSGPPVGPPPGSPTGPPPAGPPPTVTPTSAPGATPLAGGLGGNYGQIPSSGLGPSEPARQSAPAKPPPPPNLSGPSGLPGPSGPGGGFGPPAYGGFGSAGAPKKKSRAWIWVTVAVVLMVGIGAAVTLVVLQPWSDDSSSKKADEEKDSPEKAVQSDIDGDGRGDAVYRIRYDYDNVKQVTALSDGEKFETSETAVDADSKSQQMYLDWDGDGVNEDLTTNVIGSASQLTLSSADDDWPEDQTFTFSFSSLREYGDPDMRVTHGDFDGDGNEDLAVAGQNKKKVDIYVLAGDGKGTFADPSPWVSVPNAVIDVMSFYPGDFDKDGDADLWVELPSGRLDAKAYKTGYYGDRGYELLTSDGKSFTPGAVVKAPGYYNLLLVGDVTGDGTDSIVGVDSDSYNKSVTITVFDVSGGQMTTVTGFAGSSKIGKRTVQSAQLSDVDGDGKADIVFAAKDYEEKAFTGLQVMRSTGAVFESASVWAEIPVCPDDSCRLEFEGAADRY